jgi:hypothetical protein
MKKDNTAYRMAKTNRTKGGSLGCSFTYCVKLRGSTQKMTFTKRYEEVARVVLWLSGKGAFWVMGTAGINVL